MDVENMHLKQDTRLVNIEQFSVLSDGLNNYKKRELSEALFT